MRSIYKIILILALAGIVPEGAAQARLARTQNRVKENRSERLTQEGLALAQQGKSRMALLKFEEAIRLDAQNAVAYSCAALLYFKENKSERAQQYAATALRLQPNNARAHYVTAQLLLRERKNLAAYDHLHKAMRYAADQPDGFESKRLLARLRKDNPNLLQPSSQPVLEPAPDQATAATSGNKPLLAVFAFEEARADSAEENLGKVFSEMLTTALINGGAYRLIERSQLERVFEEQALGQSGALEGETAVAVGNILGVHAVVVGTLSRPARAFEADARILNVSTGEAVAACSARGASAEHLRQMAESLATTMAAKTALVQNAVKQDSTQTREQN